MSAPPSRCAVHPARPAVDACPRCARGRCGADAAHAPEGGCLACRAAAVPDAGRVTRPPSDLELVVRGGLAALVTGLLGGAVTTQYVGAKWFSIITPALVGIACGAMATAAARAPARTRAAGYVRAVAMVAAVIGTAYGFRLVVGGESAFTPWGRVLPPYLAAAAGAYVWTLPPRRRPDAPPG